MGPWTVRLQGPGALGVTPDEKMGLRISPFEFWSCGGVVGSVRESGVSWRESRGKLDEKVGDMGETWAVSSFPAALRPASPPASLQLSPAASSSPFRCSQSFLSASPHFSPASPAAAVPILSPAYPGFIQLPHNRPTTPLRF